MSVDRIEQAAEMLSELASRDSDLKTLPHEEWAASMGIAALRILTDQQRQEVAARADDLWEMTLESGDPAGD